MYEQYLQALLEPLGVYNFEAGGIQRAELAALGAELDRISGRLEQAEREGITATAVNQGLSRREALFLHRPAAATAEDRRAAIAALLQIDGDSLTPSAINLTLRGCGIKAWAQEKGTAACGCCFRRWREFRRDSNGSKPSFWRFFPVIWRWSFTSVISRGMSVSALRSHGKAWRQPRIHGTVSSWRFLP